MKLESKHLCAYLPHDIEVFEINTNKTFTLDEYGLYSISENFGYENYKPILYPISMLTKEIEVNGEKFAPIEYFEIGDDENLSLEYDHGNIKLIRSLESLSKNGFVNDINYIPFGVIEKLLELHFDIYELIPNNLAIDKKTLK